MIVDTCIAKECGAGIPTGRLMCRLHWYMVPPVVRKRIQRTGRNTSEHAEAIDDAIRAVAELESGVKILWSGKLGGAR